MNTPHLIAATIAGATAAGATAIVSAGTLLAQASGSASDGGELANVLTGGGALGLTGVLGFIALKLSRGELVVRDVAASEAALLRVAEERKADADEARRVADASNSLTREAIEVLAAATATIKDLRP